MQAGQSTDTLDGMGKGTDNCKASNGGMLSMLGSGLSVSDRQINQHIRAALEHLAQVQTAQAVRNHAGETAERGSRGKTLGGKHMDGFKDLFLWHVHQLGIPEEYFYTELVVPGTMQRSKTWDAALLFGDGDISRKGFIILDEYKQISGSYGRNFNNRIEELLGSAAATRHAFSRFAPEVPLLLRHVFVVVDDGSGELDRKPIPRKNVSELIDDLPLENLTLRDRFRYAWSQLRESGRIWDEVALIEFNPKTKIFSEPVPELSMKASIQGLERLASGE